MSNPRGVRAWRRPRLEILDPSPQDVPAVCDPCWSGLSLPLLAFIRKAKAATIDAIVAWGSEQGRGGTVTRHMLAWLSFQDLVRYDEVKRVWRSGSLRNTSAELPEAPYGSETRKLVVRGLPESCQ